MADGVLPGPDPSVLADCVHCGFCLPSCPTYQLWGEEMDTPRGRIWLMDLLERGEAALDDTVVGHFDACLGCMACVTSCPSGVAYDRLIEPIRAQVERDHRRPVPERVGRALLFALFPYRRRLRAAAWGAWAYRRSGLQGLVRRSGITERLPPHLQALEALVPDVSAADLRVRLPERVPARGATRRRVGLLTGCVQSVFFARVNLATARVLAAEGCEVVIPAAQGCCGALELHSGRDVVAAERARGLIAAFEQARVETVVTNAAGCGSTLKTYAELLEADPAWRDRAATFAERARDVHELLAELEPRAQRWPIPGRVAYHDACHLAHAQGVRAEPRALLSTIPGLELVELAEPELCCGSAGVYNLLQPEPAAELGQRKAAHVAAAGPDALASANPGCLLQLRRHLGGDALPAFHPVELLDAALRGVDPLARHARR